MNRAAVLISITVPMCAACMIILWLTDTPLGISGAAEWIWPRIPWQEADVWALPVDGLLLLFFGGIYGLLVWQGANKIDSASAFATGCWLTALAGVSFGWLFVLQLAPPEGYGIEKSAWVLYSQAASGYFFEARYREEPLDEYLANYETDIQTEDRARRILHHGTHPPGLFLFYRGLIALCESSPSLVRFIIGTQPGTVQAMFDELQPPADSNQNTLPEIDRAVIWLAAMLTQFFGALVVVPLFCLARAISQPRSAWLAAAFWPLVPALAVFLPKSDVLNTFFGVLFLAAWWSGWKRQSLTCCFLSGVVFWLGMMLSLAVLPVAFLGGLWTFWEMIFAEESTTANTNLKHPVVLMLVSLAGFFLMATGFSLVARMNLAGVWLQNYRNHAEFYQHYPRSYGAWLVVNPLETIFALGVPVVVMALGPILKQFTQQNQWQTSQWGPIVAFFGMMSVLWLSGKNRGETARLWMVVFPYFLWIGSRFWNSDNSSKPHNRQNQALEIVFLALQMVICSLTVLRVNGFSL